MSALLPKGGSPKVYHTNWLTETRLDWITAGTSGHLGWSIFFETALCYDPLNVTLFAFGEHGSRRSQMIHGKWNHMLLSLSGTAGGATEDDIFFQVRTSGTRGNFGVAPHSSKWISEQLALEGLAANERRNAKEERTLADKK